MVRMKGQRAITLLPVVLEKNNNKFLFFICAPRLPNQGSPRKPTKVKTVLTDGFYFGADERTRTFTRLLSLAPEASVSTNSTTSA
jgi:hypothetical protein